MEFNERFRKLMRIAEKQDTRQLINWLCEDVCDIFSTKENHGKDN